jgi:hypothetical protein
MTDKKTAVQTIAEFERLKKAFFMGDHSVFTQLHAAVYAVSLHEDIAEADRQVAFSLYTQLPTVAQALGITDASRPK